MKTTDQKQALQAAVEAALAAGHLMRRNFRVPKKINLETAHDIKLELDVKCQERITRILTRAFPDIAILGEEGVSGDPGSACRWVIDPIDGTVNFSYGIPHCCVSIALQERVTQPPARDRGRGPASPAPAATDDQYQTLTGVVYDPFCDELWTGLRGQPARLNGRVVRVSKRRELGKAVVAIGFAKYDWTVEKMLPLFTKLIRRVRKVRLMGAAALSMVYVATGRMDAYVEYNIRLWDIAAGGLIVECAGGDFHHRATAGEHTYEILASNGLLRRPLQQMANDAGPKA